MGPKSVHLTMKYLMQWLIIAGQDTILSLCHTCPHIPCLCYILVPAAPEVLPGKVTDSDGLGSNMPRRSLRLWENQEIPAQELLCFVFFLSALLSSEVNLKGQLQTDEKDTIASQKDELGGGRLESNLISSTRPLAPKCSATRLLTTKKETYMRDQNFNKGCGILEVDMYNFWLYRLGSFLLVVDQLSHYMINLSAVNL